MSNARPPSSIARPDRPVPIYSDASQRRPDRPVPIEEGGANQTPASPDRQVGWRLVGSASDASGSPTFYFLWRQKEVFYRV